MLSKQSASRNGNTHNTESRDISESAHQWRFFTNYAYVLAALQSDQQMVLREVAAQVGITERAVQRIVQDLEEGGFIQRERMGRQNRYRILREQPLRHPIEAHRTIGDLLELMTGD